MQRFFSFLLLAVFAAVPAALHAAPPHAAEISERSLSLLPRKRVPRRKFGLNAFVNDPQFGSVRRQLAEVKNTLGVKFVRVLFAWSDEVQPTPDASPDFSFYDDIAGSIPRGVDALVIITGAPEWMSQSQHWIAGDPRRTFIERWVKKVIDRYAFKGRIIGWQIWNEPNDEGNPENTLLGFRNSPENYLGLLDEVAAYSRAKNPRKKIVGAATTSINQKFPDTLEYNQQLKAGGIEDIVDIFAVHYYGDRLETLLFGGVSDFLVSISKPIWITESGEKGTTKQLNYVQRMWPFLLRGIPAIRRLYYYQFTESTHASVTYGLKNPTRGRRVSDLYIHLRDK